MVLPPGDRLSTAQQRGQEPVDAWGEPGCVHVRLSCPTRAFVASPLQGPPGAGTTGATATFSLCVPTVILGFEPRGSVFPLLRVL